MSRRRHAAHHEEEHENHERWLVTYADMITLLMVLFIVLFAMSQVDQKKFNALKEGLAAGFGQSTSVLDGSESILEEPGSSAIEPIAPNKAFEDLPELDQIKLAGAIQEAERLKTQKAYATAAMEADRLVGIERRIHKALQEHDLDDDVRTKIDGRGLTVSLVSRHVVFEANLATLTDRGRQVVGVLAPVLRAIDDKLQIEGHTNQAAGKPAFYATDWDLSTARAVTVLRFLNEVAGVPADRLAAVGYGHIKPLVPVAQPGSQELNKRVDIIVLSQLAEENSKLLAQVMYDRDHGDDPAPTETDTPTPGNAAPSTDHPTEGHRS